MWTQLKAKLTLLYEPCANILRVVFKGFQFTEGPSHHCVTRGHQHETMMVKLYHLIDRDNTNSNCLLWGQNIVVLQGIVSLVLISAGDFTDLGFMTRRLLLDSSEKRYRRSMLPQKQAKTRVMRKGERRYSWDSKNTRCLVFWPCLVV